MQLHNCYMTVTLCNAILSWSITCHLNMLKYHICDGGYSWKLQAICIHFRITVTTIQAKNTLYVQTDMSQSEIMQTISDNLSHKLPSNDV